MIYNVSRTGKVEVFPVSFMADTGMGMDNQLAATISAGKIQKVVLREGLVNSVNVAVGDTVKRGGTFS